MATMTLLSFIPAKMLDRAGNADRDVEVRGHDLAGLAHLPVIRRIATNPPPRVTGANGGTQLVCQPFDHS
jgi:hypothetical protein